MRIPAQVEALISYIDLLSTNNFLSIDGETGVGKMKRAKILMVS